MYSGLRLGAAKALARCADVLAGERELASDYLLEALLQSLHALRLAEADARGTGTRAQLAEAIKVRCPLCLGPNSFGFLACMEP